MRKAYMFMMLSLDGYFEGPNHDISWHSGVDEEFNTFIVDSWLNELDMFMWGRRTYQFMEEFWPEAESDPKMSKSNLKVAHLMNNTPKMVFSHTLKSVKERKNWKNVKLVSEFNVDEINKFKKEPGKGIWVGGSELATHFIEAGLIDEFRFMVNPVIIGKGTPILSGLSHNLKLELIKTHSFKSGNILLCYRPAKG